MGQREKHRGRHPPYTARMAGWILGWTADVRVGDLADRDADLLRALGSQLIDDHRAARSPGRADQPPDIHLARTAPPWLHLADCQSRLPLPRALS